MVSRQEVRDRKVGWGGGASKKEGVGTGSKRGGDRKKGRMG